MKFPSASRSTAALAVAAKKSLKRKNATAPATATAVMTQAYHGSSKYKGYVASVEKALKQFESTTEWADLISALAKLHKCIAANVKFREVPKIVAVSKRLAQCLHPHLPAGVHLKVLENYRQIFDVIGRDELPKMLHLFAVGLFPLMEYAQIKVKTALLSVFETYLLPLGSQLRPSLPGFIGAVLLGLEEGTEFYDPSMRLLNEICETVGQETFFSCLWQALLCGPKVRLPGLTYVNHKFEKNTPIDDQLFIMGHHIDHAITALCAVADDHGSALVQRHLLDFLCSAFPPNSDHVVQADLVQIMRRCLFVVLRRDASLNRRLFNWFLNKSGSSSDNPLKEKEEDNDLHFFHTYSLPLIKLAVEEYLRLGTVDVATTQSINAAVGGSYDIDAIDLQVQFTEVRVCRMLTYVLDRGQLGHLILEECLAMFLAYACKHDCDMTVENGRVLVQRSISQETRKTTSDKTDEQTKRITEIGKTFNVLLNNLDAGHLWQFLSRLFKNLLQFPARESADDLEQTIEQKQKREYKEAKRTEHLKLFPSMVKMCIRVVQLDSHSDIRGRYLAELLHTIISCICQQGCDKFTHDNLVALIAVCQMLLREISSRSLDYGSGRGETHGNNSRLISVSDTEMSDQEKIEKCLEKSKELMIMVCEYYRQHRDVERADVLYATTALLKDFSEFSIFWFGGDKESDENEPKNFWQQFFGAPRQRSSIPHDIIGSDPEPAWLQALINVIDVDSWMTEEDKSSDFAVRAMILDLIVFIYVGSSAVIETHEAVVGRTGSYLYSSEKTTTTLLLRPFLTQVAVRQLDSSEFFLNACKKLWDRLLTPYLDQAHVQSACRLLLLLHSRKQMDYSSICEDVIIGDLTNNDVGTHCRAAQKFSIFWSMNRAQTKLFPGLPAKPTNKVLMILLGVLSEEGINRRQVELRNVANSWFVDCAKHNDLPRILEMLSVLLWSPTTSRVSIQHVHIQSRCNHSDLSAMPSGLNDVSLKTANSRKTLHHMCAEDGSVGDVEHEDVLFSYMSNHALLNELRKRLLMSPTTENLFQQEQPVSCKTHKRTTSDIPNFDDDNLSNDESFCEADAVSMDPSNQVVFETLQFIVDTVVLEMEGEGDGEPEHDEANEAFYEPNDDNVSIAESTKTVRSRSSLPPKLSACEANEVQVAGGVRPSASSAQLINMAGSTSNGSVTSAPSRTDPPSTSTAPSVSVKRVKTGHRRQDSLQESIFSMTTQELRLFDASELPKMTAPGDGKQPLFDELHAHMLLYEDSGRAVDLGRCEEVFRILSSLITCHQSTMVGRMIVNCMASTGTANLVTSPNSDQDRTPLNCTLGELVAKHSRSILGYDFFPEAGSEPADDFASAKAKQHSTFLEILITAALYFLRSYFLNSPVTPVYEADLTLSWKCKIAALEFLTDLVRELRSMVKEQQSRAFVAYLHAILTRSKLQRCILHLLLGVVHSPSTSGIGMSPLSVQIASFNTGPRKQQQFDFLISAYHKALLDLTSTVIGMEYEIKNGFQNYVEQQNSSVSGYMDKMSINHQVYNSPQIRSTVREPHVGIVELRLFLCVVLNALKKRPERHSIWLQFLVNILPYLDRSLPTVAVHVVEQLCKNLDTAVMAAYPVSEDGEAILYVGDSISMRSTPSHTPRNLPSNGNLNGLDIPPDYGIMTLETLATMFHYCLIDSTASHINSPSILPTGGSSTSSTSGWTATGAASIVGSAMSVIPGTLSSLMKVLTFSDSGSTAAPGSKDPRGNGVLKQARGELMRTFPHALSTICDVWATMKRGNQAKIPIGNKAVLRRMVIELLSPIAQNHQSTFLNSVAMVWLTRRSAKQQALQRFEPDQPSFAYSESQNDIADLIVSIKVLPFESLIATITDSLKEYGTKTGKLSTSGSEKQSTSSFPVEVSLLELLHACIRHSQSAIRGCWTALHTMISEAPLSLLPPRAVFLQFMILVDFVKISGSHSIIEDKQLSRSVQDACQKLTDAVNMIIGWQLEQPTWLKRTLVVKQDTGSIKSMDLSPTIDFSTTPGSLLASESNSIKGSTTSLAGGSGKYDIQLGTSTSSQTPSTIGGFEKKSSSNLRSSLKDSVKRDPSLSTQALFLLADNVAELVDSICKSEDKDRLLSSITNVWNNTLPFLKAKHTRNARFFLAGSQFLASMSSFNYMRSVWRKSVVDLVGDVGFFKMDQHALKQWLIIVDHLTTHDKSSFKEIMSATAAANTGISGIMSNKESDYDHRASVLKRLAFVILSAEKDQFQTLMPDIQERLADNLRLNQVPVVHTQVFLCFRVLLLRFKPTNLTSIWPSMICELISVLMLIEQELTSFSNNQQDDSRNSSSDQNMQLFLSACKLLETLCTLPAGHITQYQMCNWTFVSATAPFARDLFKSYTSRIHDLLQTKCGSLTDDERKVASASLTGIKTLTDFKELRPFFEALANQHNYLPGQNAEQLWNAEALHGSLSLKEAVTRLEQGLAEGGVVNVDPAVGGALAKEGSNSPQITSAPTQEAVVLLLVSDSKPGDAYLTSCWDRNAHMRPPSSSKDVPPESDSQPTILSVLSHEKGLRGGESSNRCVGAAAEGAPASSASGARVETPSAEVGARGAARQSRAAATSDASGTSSEAADGQLEWIPRHSAFMDLRVRSAKRKTYAEINDDDGFEAEADADSDWSEKRSKRVAKKRERYSPGGGNKAAMVVAGAPKAKVAKKAPKKPSTRRKTQTYYTRPRKPIPRGIDNPDLTCYVNCVLQSIFCNDAVKEFLLKLPDSADLFEALNGELGNVLIIDELRKIMVGLNKANQAIRRIPTISTESFMVVVRQVMPEFRVPGHYDAHEFFIKFSQRMHDELKLLKNSSVLADWIYKLNVKLSTSKCSVPASDPSRTMISAFFQGTLETTKICEVCGTVSTTEDVVYDLGLPLINNHRQTQYSSIEECLATYFTGNETDDSHVRVFYCERCVQECKMIKSTFFKIPPLILCLQLRRYTNNGGKIDPPVKYPLDGLDITNYVKIPSRAEELAEEGSSNDSYSSFGATKQPHQYVYSLFSAICHRGHNTRNGHYLSYGKTNGEWYLFNDTRVRPSSDVEILRQKPYILFYRREN